MRVRDDRSGAACPCVHKKAVTLELPGKGKCPSATAYGDGGHVAGMDRSPSRLRSAGGSVASGSSIPTSPDSQYDGRSSLVGRSTRAADHARDQVQSALDGLLSEDDPSNPRSSPGRYAPPMDSARSPGQPEAQGRRSFVPPEPIIPIEASYPRSGRSSTDLLSPARKASSVKADGGGYTPTGAGGRRYALAKHLKFWVRG